VLGVVAAPAGDDDERDSGEGTKTRRDRSAHRATIRDIYEMTARAT
jgi:hypothetical protein